MQKDTRNSKINREKEQIMWFRKEIVKIKKQKQPTKYRVQKDTVKNKKESDFKPSTNVLLRILKTITDNGAEAKTPLAIDSNLNYTRLVKHIVWMEAKGFVKSTIDESKIKVSLTEKGKEFASILTNDMDK
jgi:predicted transcriptional regulator